jgi:hypothetical protein
MPWAARRCIATPPLMMADCYPTPMSLSRADKLRSFERSKTRNLSQLQKIITFSTAKIKYAKNFENYIFLLPHFTLGELSIVKN